MQRLEGSTYVQVRYGNGGTKKFISVYSRFIKVLLFDQLLLNPFNTQQYYLTEKRAYRSNTVP